MLWDAAACEEAEAVHGWQSWDSNLVASALMPVTAASQTPLSPLLYVTSVNTSHGMEAEGAPEMYLKRAFRGGPCSEESRDHTEVDCKRLG